MRRVSPSGASALMTSVGSGDAGSRLRFLGGRRLSRGMRLDARGELGKACDFLRIAAEFPDERRQERDRLAQRREHAARALERAIDDAVQQVLDRPGEVADAAGADDAATAFQRMECAAYAGQRLAIRGILGPEREQAADGRDLLARLLDEEREQLRVDGRVAARWRRVAAQARAAALARRRASRRARGHRAHAVERDEAALGVVEHVPGVAAAGLQRLHVVLDADDRIRQPVDVLVIAREAARAQQRRDVIADAAHDLHRAVAAQQQQARSDAACERRRGVEAGLVAGRFERVAEQFLDAREIDDALAQHRLGDLPEFGVGLGARRGRARRHDEANERVVEAVFDADQRRRDRDQRVLLGRRAARDDIGQARQLALHLLAH